MIKTLITEFPLSDFPKERTITEEKIRKYTYTKEEVDVLISNAVKEAVEEAVRIDEASMAKHNREATVISMILGFTTLALFVDGLLRMLGIVPPFMEIDINILDKIETDIIDKIKQVPIQKLFQHGFEDTNMSDDTLDYILNVTNTLQLFEQFKFIYIPSELRYTNVL